MSGHNRWSKIKHKKLAGDVRKSKGWTKFIREITLAARMGGGDPGGNPRLRAAIEKARGDNMPNDTISRAIKKGTGEGSEVQYEELLYEVYGPGGTAIIVELMTDNRNRTASEVRHLLEKHNAKLGASGSVLYLFKKRGIIVFEAGAIDEDKLMEAALDLGAEDVQSSEEDVTVFTEPASYFDVKEGLEKRDFKAANGEVAMVPDSTIHLEGKEAESMARLINVLEEHDDVQNVYCNADIDDEVMESIDS